MSIKVKLYIWLTLDTLYPVIPLKKGCEKFESIYIFGYSPKLSSFMIILILGISFIIKTTNSIYKIEIFEK
jgi:hypothetical protein